VAAADRGQWELVRIRPWDRLLALWRGLALDAQLAEGQHAEDDHLMAVRASMLTAPAERDKVAAAWDNVLDRLPRPRQPLDGRVPVRRSTALAAEDDVRHMIALLRASTPVPARGVAIANLLLTDGTGPLYNARSTTDLGAAVRDAVRHLDPWTGIDESTMGV